MTTAKDLHARSKALESRDHVSQTQPSRMSDRTGGGGGPTQLVVVRFVDAIAQLMYVQEVRYSDTDNPVEGVVEAFGDWLRVYPMVSHVYASFVPFVVPLFRLDGSQITDPASYDAAVAAGDITAQTLGNDATGQNIDGTDFVPCEVITDTSGVLQLSVRDKFPASMTAVDPDKLLPNPSLA